MEDGMADNNLLVTAAITTDVIAGLDLAGNRFKKCLTDDKSSFPGRAEREPQMCNCTSGNLEIPGLVLRTIPE
jgi:hypothetical protein